jgi:Flp pilus assembly protein TadD
MKKFSQYAGYLVIMLMILVLTESCSLIRPEEPKPKPKPSSQQSTKPKPPDVSKTISQGVSQLEAGQVNKAIATFEKAQKQDPKNAEAAQYLDQARAKRQDLIHHHLNQGIEYFRKEQLQEALREWNAVLELDPKHSEALDYKARTQKMLEALGN